MDHGSNVKRTTIKLLGKKDSIKSLISRARQRVELSDMITKESFMQKKDKLDFIKI